MANKDKIIKLQQARIEELEIENHELKQEINYMHDNLDEVFMKKRIVRVCEEEAK